MKFSLRLLLIVLTLSALVVWTLVNVPLAPFGIVGSLPALLLAAVIAYRLRSAWFLLATGLFCYAMGLIAVGFLRIHWRPGVTLLDRWISLPLYVWQETYWITLPVILLLGTLVAIYQILQAAPSPPPQDAEVQRLTPRPVPLPSAPLDRAEDSTRKLLRDG